MDDYEKKETLAAVMEIINTELSDRERKIILDSFFSDKTDTVLADELGMSTALFSYHKHKALAKVKAIFDKNN